MDSHNHPRRYLMGPALVALALLATACPGQPDPIDESPSPSPTTSPTIDPERERVWGQIETDTAPEPRRDLAMAHLDGSIYVFGGRRGSEPLGDTWRFDLETRRWSEIDTPGPPPRFGHNMVATGSSLIMFGGQDGPSSFRDDTWQFISGQWRPQKVGTRPAARYGAGGALVDGKLLISHGFTNSGRFDDSWTFAGTDWEEVSPVSGTRPSKRCLLQVAYLEKAGAVILFGGQSNEEPFLADTWAFDPEGRRWLKVPTEGPSARNLYAAASSKDAMYVFGGRGRGGALNDLWRFDGVNWNLMNAEGAPSPRHGSAMVHVDGDLYVFGGQDGTGDLAELWHL